MSTVVVLNVNHTGNGNASWKASPEKIRNVKYIVTEKNGKVYGVYTAEDIKVNSSGRVNFKNFRRAPTKIYYRLKNMDVSRKRGEANPVRYKEFNIWWKPATK